MELDFVPANDKSRHDVSDAGQTVEQFVFTVVTRPPLFSVRSSERMMLTMANGDRQPYLEGFDKVTVTKEVGLDTQI